MSVRDTLERLLEREAEKLDKLSQTNEAPLGDKDLERIALLARCAKAVRSQTSAQSEESGDDSTPSAELLKAAT